MAADSSFDIFSVIQYDAEAFFGLFGWFLPATSVATLFCREAPEMFCGPRCLTQHSISMGAR